MALDALKALPLVVRNNITVLTWAIKLHCVNGFQASPEIAMVAERSFQRAELQQKAQERLQVVSGANYHVTV